MRGYLQRLNQIGRDIITKLTESKIKIGDTLHNLEQSAPAAKVSISNTFAKAISDIQARQQQLLHHVDVEVCVCVCVCVCVRACLVRLTSPHSYIGVRVS